MARPEGIEPPAYRFEACRSIQLSYGRVLLKLKHLAFLISITPSCRYAGFYAGLSGSKSVPNTIARVGSERIYAITHRHGALERSASTAETASQPINGTCRIVHAQSASRTAIL